MLLQAPDFETVQPLRRPSRTVSHGPSPDHGSHRPDRWFDVETESPDRLPPSETPNAAGLRTSEVFPIPARLPG